MNQRVPCADDVFDRVKSGEVIRLDGSYSYQSRFDDGTLIPHQVMQSLFYNNRLIKPAHRGEAWTMHEVQTS